MSVFADRRRRRAERRLAALADGSLTGSAARAAERTAAESPRLRASLSEQRQAVEAVRRVAPDAPAGLKARVEASVSERPRRPARGWLLVPAGGVAAVAIVLGVVTGGAGPPTVAAVAGLGSRAATAPAPPAHDHVLALAVGGVPYPNLAPRYGWRATGERSDTISGRRMTTVFYAKGTQRIAYTIVAGGPLRLPAGRAWVAEGTRFRAAPDGVTWERRGHTCVLTGTGVARAKLTDLASYRAEGSIPA